MASYQIEAWLRPIHEYYAATIHACGVFLCLVAPELLLLSPTIGYWFAALFGTRMLLRWHQGRQVHRYQANLWRYTPYVIKRKRLPVSTHQLFLGSGFQWTQDHTQRLSDIDAQSVYGVIPPYYKWARRQERRFEHTPFIGTLVLLLSLKTRLNPFRLSRPPGNIGSTHLHALGSPEGYERVFLDDEQRTGHLAIFGTTGVGKTVLISNLARQDIGAGHVVIVIDPKSDVDLFFSLYQEARRARRLDNFHCFHLGFTEYSSAYSPIATYSRITEIANRIASQLPSEGQSAAFRQFVWRMVNVIARARTQMGHKLDVRDILRYGQNIDPLAEDYLVHALEQSNHRVGAWKADIDAKLKENTKARKGRVLADYYRTHKIDDPLAESLIYFLEYPKAHMDKLTGSLLPLMEKLTSGKIVELLAPDYGDGSRPVFSWPEIIRSGGVVYVGLDSLTDGEVGSAVGSSMLADLTSTLGEIYKHGDPDARVKICLYADEAAEIVNDQFVKLLNKGRGAGLRVTLGAQTVQDLPVGFGDRDKADQAVGNVNGYILLRAVNEKTAEVLTSKLREVKVHSILDLSSTAANPDTESPESFRSSNEQRLTKDGVPMLSPPHLITLPPGEAFAFIDGGTLYKIKIPLVTDQQGRGAMTFEQIFQQITELDADTTITNPRPRTIPVNVTPEPEVEAA